MSNSSIQSYRDLIVWQRGIDLVTALYEITEKFPKEEEFGLKSQMRRAAVSIPSNIAEGHRRGGKSFLQYIRIAYGSGAELETQLTIAKLLPGTRQCVYTELENLLSEEMKMLNALFYSLKSKSKKPAQKETEPVEMPSAA